MKYTFAEVTEFEQLKNVYQTTFAGEPYNEDIPDELVSELFEEYIRVENDPNRKDNIFIGAFADTECIGFVAIKKGFEEGQPVEFDKNENIMYLADIAVLPEYWKNGVGTHLAINGMMEAIKKGCDRIYLRTLEEKSMSAPVVMGLGWKKIPNACQLVTRHHVDGSTSEGREVFYACDMRDRALVKKTIADKLQKMKNHFEEKKHLEESGSEGR